MYQADTTGCGRYCDRDRNRIFELCAMVGLESEATTLLEKAPV